MIIGCCFLIYLFRVKPLLYFFDKYTHWPLDRFGWKSSWMAVAFCSCLMFFPLEFRGQHFSRPRGVFNTPTPAAQEICVSPENDWTLKIPPCDGLDTSNTTQRLVVRRGFELANSRSLAQCLNHSATKSRFCPHHRKGVDLGPQSARLEGSC